MTQHLTSPPLPQADLSPGGRAHFEDREEMTWSRRPCAGGVAHPLNLPIQVAGSQKVQ